MLADEKRAGRNNIALILIAVKRRNIDRKGLLVFYFISSAGGILAAIIRVLKELSVTQVIAKGDKEAKRKLIIG